MLPSSPAPRSALPSTPVATTARSAAPADAARPGGFQHRLADALAADDTTGAAQNVAAPPPVTSDSGTTALPTGQASAKSALPPPATPDAGLIILGSNAQSAPAQPVKPRAGPGRETTAKQAADDAATGAPGDASVLLSVTPDPILQPQTSLVSGPGVGTDPKQPAAPAGAGQGALAIGQGQPTAAAPAPPTGPISEPDQAAAASQASPAQSAAAAAAGSPATVSDPKALLRNRSAAARLGEAGDPTHSDEEATTDPAGGSATSSAEARSAPPPSASTRPADVATAMNMAAQAQLAPSAARSPVNQASDTQGKRQLAISQRLGGQEPSAPGKESGPAAAADGSAGPSTTAAPSPTDLAIAIAHPADGDQRSSGATSSAKAAPAGPTPPSAQLADAIAQPVRVVLSGSGQHAGAPQTLTVHLAPAELGRVEVRIERTSGGPARIELTAERPETLVRLVQDQSQLHHALDQAGIPAENRTLHFTLATSSSSAGGSAGSSFNSGGAQNGAQHRQQSGQNSPWTHDDIELTPSVATWSRAGLDITA